MGISELNPGDKVVVFCSGEPLYEALKDVLSVYKDRGLEIQVYQLKKRGTNALDFMLSTYLGYEISQPGEKEIYILSADKGYEPAIELAEDLGLAMKVDYRDSIYNCLHDTKRDKRERDTDTDIKAARPEKDISELREKEQARKLARTAPAKTVVRKTNGSKTPAAPRKESPVPECAKKETARREKEAEKRELERKEAEAKAKAEAEAKAKAEAEAKARAEAEAKAKAEAEARKREAETIEERVARRREVARQRQARMAAQTSGVIEVSGPVADGPILLGPGPEEESGTKAILPGPGPSDPAPILLGEGPVILSDQIELTPQEPQEEDIREVKEEAQVKRPTGRLANEGRLGSPKKDNKKTDSKKLVSNPLHKPTHAQVKQKRAEFEKRMIRDKEIPAKYHTQLVAFMERSETSGDFLKAAKKIFGPTDEQYLDSAISYYKAYRQQKL